MHERAAARARGICLSGALACALACGGDPRSPAARAEPPSEPPLVADGFDEPAGALRIDGEIAFAGGARLGPRVFAPAHAAPGAPIDVRFPVTGLPDGARVRVSLRAPQVAGRQEARGQASLPKGQVTDRRDRWVDAPVLAGQVEVSLEVAAPWHASHAVLVAEIAGDVAVAGPRRADGAAILGAVPIAVAPTQVSAPRAGALAVDGRLEEAAWAEQAGTALGQSLDGEPDPEWTADAAPGSLGALDPRLGTRVAFAWDEAHLYVAADLPDADLWSDYRAQDDPLYKQEAFELFVAAGNDGRRYLEFQVSPRGVTFDARFPRHRAGDEAWDSRWRTAARAEGTVDEPRDRDRGFVVEAAIPWEELCAETDLECPPRPGMTLRVNAFRIERVGRRRAVGLSLSPTRVPDFHAWDNAAVLVLR